MKKSVELIFVVTERDKRAKFIELAENRVNRAIKDKQRAEQCPARCQAMSRINGQI